MTNYRDEDDALYEMFAQTDYLREAYGWPCSIHPEVLTGGGDCWKCMNEVADIELWQAQLEEIIEHGDGSGQFAVTRENRRDIMQFLTARGCRRVRCVGSTVVWEAK